VLGAIVAGGTALRAVRKTQELEDELEDAGDPPFVTTPAPEDPLRSA
jgi:hypothetical protein